jgi:hypothetical protein
LRLESQINEAKLVVFSFQEKNGEKNENTHQQITMTQEEKNIILK